MRMMDLSYLSLFIRGRYGYGPESVDDERYRRPDQEYVECLLLSHVRVWVNYFYLVLLNFSGTPTSIYPLSKWFINTSVNIKYHVL